MIEKPVFIIKGLDYDRQSGGVRALHELARMLYERGERVIMPYCKTKYELSQVGEDEDATTILILPEVVAGICPSANVTVRWLLNKPGKTNANVVNTWGRNELFFHFENHFALQASEPLCVPHVDESIFHNKDNVHDIFRDIDCFYSHKAYLHGVDRMIPKNAVDVSPLSKVVKKGDWEALAKLFRRCRTLYAMEETATTLEAALCGAKIEYITSDYLPERPPIEDHISWYENIKVRSKSEVDNFIAICYRRAGLSLWRHTVKACA